MSKVTMFHPEAGTMQCSPSAVRIHRRSGWEVVDGPEAVTLPAADGGSLTTGTVFPPESFDDDQELSEGDVDDLDESGDD